MFNIPFFIVGPVSSGVAPFSMEYVTSYYYVANENADVTFSTEYYYSPAVESVEPEPIIGYLTSFYYIANESTDTVFSTDNYYNPIIE